ncbi:sensor histidine kinase [Falsiroseomonas sp.]|uniref:sensor histidine kinase n=1 Tax=Falsiroseomonas sp. TaxID=2870721 RepID=UPI003F6F5BD0
MRRKPRILTVLLLSNLVLLGLPLGGLWLLRLYESALVRQTETELVAQAAVLAAAYRLEWQGPEAAPTPRAPLAPRPAGLDLARDPVRPLAPTALPGPAPEPRAAAAGARLGPVLVETQRITLAGIRLLDRQGVVVATSREELGLSLAAMEEVQAALAGQAISSLRARRVDADQPRGAASLSRGAALRVVVTQPVEQAGQVIGAVLLSRTPPGIDQTIYNNRHAFGGLALALLLAAGLLAAFTAYAVSRPIQAVTARARAVAAGQRPPPGRVRRSAVREADELAAAIQAMAATLEQRADYIRGFATEVSHEFKTPLAGLRGALELLQDHAASMAPAERDRFLAQAAGDVDRLDRLVRRLLELARAEAPLPQTPARCALEPVVQAAADAFPGLRWQSENPEPAPPLAVPAEALRAALACLFENTLQHAGPGASCRLSWQAEEGWLLLEVADDGRGISPGNASRIFDRFFTTARETGGTGLGLTIARSRLEAAGGSLQLVPGGPGARFRLRLPLA